MLSRAKSKYVRISPYKLRPIVDVIRGSQVGKALAWLKASETKRTKPITKVLEAAFANVRNLHVEEADMNTLYIKEVRVDQGPVIKYFKPGAQGRANIQRKRMSHIEIILDKKK
ncbi:50S ribosomal protein L22 [bacterium]|nr:MAG: 50S ribosomal protein L22 [bacterium]